MLWASIHNHLTTSQFHNGVASGAQLGARQFTNDGIECMRARWFKLLNMYLNCAIFMQVYRIFQKQKTVKLIKASMSLLAYIVVYHDTNGITGSSSNVRYNKLVSARW